MIPMEIGSAVVNHLWQSTVVVAIAWVLTLALRRNQARVRYWVWMAASVKFLLPFSLLIVAGERVRGLMPATVVTRPAVVNAMEQLALPYAEAQFFGSAIPVGAQHVNWWAVLLAGVWVCGAVIVAARFVFGWWKVYRAKRAAKRLEFAADVRVYSTAVLIEPGVWGIFRPVLLLPEGIIEKLTAEQMRTVIAHEMAHVRRRDNLTFALHMSVEVLFWFYPPVWWIGARLIDERERACDEAVVQAGGGAQAYAEGILSVCKFYVESPVACVTGVTGADLKKRIRHILAEKMAQNLGTGRKLLLFASASFVVSLPLMLGFMRTMQAMAQDRSKEPEVILPRFDVVSIRPIQENVDRKMDVVFTADGIHITGLPLHMLMNDVFGLPDDRILNQPDWVKSSRYDIEAKVDPMDAPKLKGLTRQERWGMLVPVLQKRFGLKLHDESRVLNVYTLVAAKSGAKLVEAKVPDSKDKLLAQQLTMLFTAQGLRLEGHGESVSTLAHVISLQIGSTVVDKTGLTGVYDYSLTWDPSRRSLPLMPITDNIEPSPTDSGPSLFAALTEQLGLRLVAQKQPVEVLVIDRVEKPSEN